MRLLLLLLLFVELKIPVALSSGIYDMDKPDHVDFLPQILAEASGLTDVSANEVALVQDEKGILFVFDLEKKKVTKEIPFGSDGDYEGLTRVGDLIYVLESNGTLHKIRNWKTKPMVERLALRLPTKDNEGLGYDPVNSQLLIAPKSKWMKGKDAKNLRPIFALDDHSNEVRKEPAFVFDIQKISDFVKRRGLNLPIKVKKTGEKSTRLLFKPASVAVHPLNNDLFIVSAVDKTLVSFDRKGEVSNYWQLDEKIFRKPEGITFLPNATLVIASEADGDKATLMQFRMRHKK